MEGLSSRLKAVICHSQALLKRLQEYERLAENPVDNAFARGRVLAAIAAADFPDSELRSELGRWLTGERSAVEKDQEEFRYRFGTQFAESLTGFGLKARGQLPVLRVGMFSVRLDLSAGSAALFWGPEVELLKAGVALLPVGLAETIDRWTRDLKAKATEPARMRKSLYEAYRRSCVLLGVEEGSRVLVADALAELVMMLQPKSFRQDPARARFVEYPRVRFSYDLYCLRSAAHDETAPARLRLHVANFDATTEKSKAIWVPDNQDGDGTYYSYISFGGQ